MPRIIEEFKINEFRGLDTETKNLKEIPLISARDGYATFSPDSLNWISRANLKGIELRRGAKLLGTTRIMGSGKITGLGTGIRFDGVQVPFWSHGRKVKYYNKSGDDSVEVGTDLLPATADGEEVSIFPYNNLAGAFVYLSSPNSSIYKIPVANPGNAKDQSQLNFRGFLKFGPNRSFLFNRNGQDPGNKDKTSLFTSKRDRVQLSEYPAQVAGESVGTGDGTTKTFNATLAQITGVRTAFFVEVTDTVETFRDNRNGGLIGSAGGTGTVNYATGAISVTFNTAPANAQAITANYYYEDATTTPGTLDFTNGNKFPQYDGGGNLNSVFPLATVFYCFHELKTWQVTFPTDETAVKTNLPFREKMGVNSHYGAHGGERGIYFVNTATEKPEFMRLELFTGTTEANVAAPKLLSELIDLSVFNFDKAQIFEWMDYVLIACRRIIAGVVENENSRTLIYNKKSGVFDILDYAVSRFAEYEGALLGGDSLTNNVFILFSGIDDDGFKIPNYWTSGQINFGIPGQKRFTRLAFEGFIQKTQKVKISLKYDEGNFVEVATIDGQGSYVNQAASASVGSNTIGSTTIGGGGEISAAPFRVEFRIQSPLHQWIRLKLEAVQLGYVSIESAAFRDIKEKSRKTMPERIA
jgi:hypothetical protein